MEQKTVPGVKRTIEEGRYQIVEKWPIRYRPNPGFKVWQRGPPLSDFTLHSGQAVMTLTDEKSFKEGALLDEGRYLMRFHIEPIGGGKVDEHYELNLYPRSCERYCKMEEIRKEMKEFHLYPGKATPRFII